FTTGRFVRVWAPARGGPGTGMRLAGKEKHDRQRAPGGQRRRGRPQRGPAAALVPARRRARRIHPAAVRARPAAAGRRLRPAASPPAGPAAPGGYGPPGSNGAAGAHSQQECGQAGPGHPRYGQWPSQPQAPKPGVIPLRPLGVGELLDGAFTSIRRNPRATLGIAALLLTASAVITTTVSLLLVHYVGSVTLPDPGQQLTDAQATRLLTRILQVLAPTSTGS